MAQSGGGNVDFPRDCSCSQLRRAARRVSRYYDQCLAGTSLRSTQYTLLGFLSTEGPMTMARLANAMTMDRATVGHNLRPLERDGLLHITISAADRRAREVAITDRGYAVLLAAHSAWQLAQAGFESAFGAQEAAELRTLMDRVIEAPLPHTASPLRPKVTAPRAAVDAIRSRRRIADRRA
ncbi:MAG: MarR family winged helix-turn-helix transcriptional regulator [Phenylobacterium sp.]|uniref:MarR family winged helix-turn-helix transcriptional regulator n=1 Tax=Phenylobacterium sp. TaxID=1871053 RepID=UPI002735355E|nr:MarR family winged helix-turn-helix transcriptional regulator [Phenylobacterium sp.]MDP3745406.1 MarR family winged helix-turn-helix transcriptional regulator [Phenylobacterium sp.]